MLLFSTIYLFYVSRNLNPGYSKCHDKYITRLETRILMKQYGRRVCYKEFSRMKFWSINFNLKKKDVILNSNCKQWECLTTNETSDFDTHTHNSFVYYKKLYK